jgi:hypothetical protein
MAMGSFPIQSDTSCACEWIVDGQTGALLSSQEPLEVAAAIAPALTDDALVDDAARRNAEVARKRLDQRIIRPQVAEMYRKVAQREPVIS